MHRPVRLGSLLVLALLTGPTACGRGADGEVDPGAIDARLHTLLDSAFAATDGVPGAMLRVEAHGAGVVWEAAVGVSDAASGAGLTARQPLRIASITKTYVAAAVLRLHEDGVVALDAPVGDHLLPATVRALRGGGYDPLTITLRMLLQHTSGVADYATTEAFLGRVLTEPSHRWTRAEQLQLAMDVSRPIGAPRATPGTEFGYSDTGYILLGEVLEQVTGDPLHTALHQLLSFDALGLDATWLESVEPPPPGAPPRPHQYLDSTDTWAFDPSFDLFGGGGLVASLADASRFLRALFEGDVFRDPETLALMTSVTPVSVAATEGGYGMGIARVRYAGVDCFGHGGFWGTVVRYCPEPDVLVAGAVTSTAGRAMLDGLVRRTLTFMLSGEVADENATLAAELAVMIPDRMEIDGVPGLNILVIRRGEVVWRASYGWADPETGRAMTPDAIFRVESISKSVTAWGVMKLAQDGVLDLDAPVVAQLRTRVVPPDASPFTTRQLLSHRAGIALGDYTARYAPDAARPSLRESIATEFAMIGEPGGTFSYSDTGFNLVELLLQDRVGTDFGEWMDQHVLDPLGMVEASYDWQPGFRDRMPTAHTLRGRPVEPYLYPGRGSGGLFASLDDVGHFVRAGAGSPPLGATAEGAAAGRQILADSSIALLYRPSARPEGLYGLVAQGYGLGHFAEVLSDGRAAVWHGGQGYGWMTHFHLVPETGDAIVLLANSQRAWPLFGHILRAWSTSLGVEPVRMSRVTWASPVAWTIIAACLAAAATLAHRAVFLLRHGSPVTAGCARRRTVRALGAASGVGLLAAVAWTSTQEYLFLFSVLPSTTRWLGAAMVVLALALIAWACPARRPRSALLGP